MRSIQEVAKEIRDEIKGIASKRSDYSVRVTSGYKIYIETQNLDKELVKEISRKVYHKESHMWLCVRVNNYWIPMPPLKAVELEDNFLTNL